ncbi:MAG: ankyrin repeat domain-containing protein, partial [Legionellaceae bacterium]|nr:ankyrin repeat domain-containing protein [Legionellaceae bacterium]
MSRCILSLDPLESIPPQAQSIPALVWNDFFKSNKETVDKFSLVESMAQEITPLYLEEFQKNAPDQMTKNLFLLCCCYRTPELSSERFLEITTLLERPRTLILELVVISGKNHLLLSAPLTQADAQSFQTLFEWASKYGNLDCINNIESIAGDNILEILKARDYNSFRWAAANGHLAVVNRLLEIADGNTLEILEADNYDAFRWAARNGHLAVVDRLLEIAGDNALEMLKADNYEVFRWAAENGQLAVVNRLLEIAGDNALEMLKADNYEAFRGAARNGHLAEVNRLLEFAGDNALEMLKAEKYTAFRGAARNGHLAVVSRLLE